MAKSRTPKKAAEAESAKEAAEPKAAARKKAAPAAKPAPRKKPAEAPAGPKAAAEPKPKAKVEPKAEPKATAEPKVKAEPKAKAEPKLKAEPKAKAKAAPRAAAATTPAPEPRLAAEAVPPAPAAPAPADKPAATRAPRAAKAPSVVFMASRMRDEPGEPAERHPTMRLHKFLAHGGAGSRREAETFIDQGRVSVNGKVVTQMGFKVDPDVDRVLLDGEPVKREKRVYFLLHKPAGFVCTNKDEVGRPRAVDLLRGVPQRVYTVGRLDVDSLGLILITNDGDLANVVCHPRYRIQKRYQVAVKGFMTRDQVSRLEAGVWLAEGKSSPAKVVPLGRNPRQNETILEMTIFEGRNREIRRVFAAIGLKVRRLLRLSIGPLEVGDLKPGEAREVKRDQLGFVDEALRLYEANREAWDAELPPPRPKVRPPFRSKPPRQGARPGFGGAPRQGGGFGPRRPAWGGAPRRDDRRDDWRGGGRGDEGPARRYDEGPARRGPDEGPARREGEGPRQPWRRPDGPPGRDPRG